VNGIRLKEILPCAMAAWLCAGAARAEDPVDLDSTAIREKLSDVNLSKTSDKVGFSGILYNRAFNHQYLDFPKNMASDAAGTALDANFTLKVSVNANSFMKVWTMLSFGYDFGGHFLNQKASTHIKQSDLPTFGTVSDTLVNDETRAPYVQDKNREAGRVFEDLLAGVALRTEPVDANVTAGGVLWMQGSPLTVWKRDPRPHPAWYFESYEPELSSNMYYTQKFYYRRNDLGRASWPKKAFGGIELDAYRMPADLGLQVDFAQPSNMLPSKTDGNTNSHAADAEALNSINSIGQLFYGRFTRKRLFKDVTGGANLLWVNIPVDIINQRVFSPNEPQGFVYQFRNGAAPYYTNPHVFSFDTRGNLGPTLFLQSDLALSMEDSVKYAPIYDSVGPRLDTVYDGRSAISHAASSPAAAAYVKLNSSGAIPLETEVFYAAKNFWSPYAMTEYAVPVHRDEMKLGTGSFSYQSNLTGVNFKYSPKISTGFLSLTVGQHVQVEKGNDILRFQHVLNGREVWYSTGSWSRTEPGRLLDEGTPYGNPKYKARLGRIVRNPDFLNLRGQPGGLRGDDLEVWEEFAAYDDTAQANAGLVPQHQKYSFSSALDWGYNLSPVVGYSRPWMLALYGSLNSIGTDLASPLNGSSTLLWSGLLRLESAFSLAPTFQIIGLVGMETWKSEKAFTNTLANKQGLNKTQPFYQKVTNPSDTANSIPYDNINYYEPLSIYALGAIPHPLVISEKTPIDYLQMAYGMGFDWDFSQRAGLHVRCKYATHEDKNLPENNWQGTFVFGEMKVWF
jgi:hypothetical protein